MPHKEDSHTVDSVLNYQLDPADGGQHTFWLGTVGERYRNHHPVPTKIEDIRGREVDFTLDKQGFQVVQSASSEALFDDEERIKTAYYAECINLLKTITGATRILPLGHIVRKQSWDEAYKAEKDLPPTSRVGAATNARFVHVDQSYNGAKQRLYHVVEDSEANEILDSGKRYAIINLWRPIGQVVRRDNLAMLDARSVSDEELQECTVKFKQETPKGDDSEKKNIYANKKDMYLWAVKPPTPETNGHRWHYVSKMKPEEALLLKIFDSKDDGETARRSPHTAFTCEEDEGPTRESLEVRMFVIWD